MKKNTNFNFNKLSPFKWFVLENFPFIEADFDALTEWQLFCKLGKEINKIINSQNIVGEQAETLTNAFNNLKNYIDNYFNNLDVQDEINNKLNEMAETGELQNIIGEFLKLNSLITFNNVQEMINSQKLIDGSFAQTLGFYSYNDGGNATYKIRKITNNDTIDNMFIISLSQNDLIAELIYNDTVNIKQLGATTNKDLKPFIERYTQISKEKLTLFIPYGSWICSEIQINTWFSIIGENIFCGKTEIRPATDNQHCIFNLHNNNFIISHWKLQDLCFVSDKTTVESCIIFDHVQYGEVKNINFQNVRGRAFIIRNSWEINFIDLIARHVVPIVVDENAGVFEFDGTDIGSISTLYFNYIQLESIIGNVFCFNKNQGIYNNHIGTINIESYNITSSDYTDNMCPEITFAPITDETTSDEHFALFKLFDNVAVGGLSINSIDTNNLASALYTYNNKTFIQDSIFYKTGAESTAKSLNCQLDMLNFVGMKKDIQIINQRNGSSNVSNRASKFIIGSVNYVSTSKSAYFNVKKEIGIQCPTSIKNITDNNSFISQNLGFFGNIATNLETAYNQTWGLQAYDKGSLNPLNLVFAPFSTYLGGGFVRMVSLNNFIVIRYKTSISTNIVIVDHSKNNTSINHPITNTNGEWAWTTIDLKNISNFNVHDIIDVCCSAGHSTQLDAFYFTNN